MRYRLLRTLYTPAHNVLVQFLLYSLLHTIRNLLRIVHTPQRRHPFSLDSRCTPIYYFLPELFQLLWDSWYGADVPMGLFDYV